MTTQTRPLLVPAFVLAAGITLGGLFAGLGLYRARAADHFVTVKGVAEEEVQADLAIWPLRVVVGSNDLDAANAEIGRSVQRLRAFLAGAGIDSSETSLQDFNVADAYANQYGRPADIAQRYVIRQTIVVRSTDPAKVLRASQRIPELVSQGVVLQSGSEYGMSAGPTFLFTQLNELKPRMIADATARAREAAEQFARDSRAELGGIRRANQGVFEIMARDQAPGIMQESQVVKTVRVVSTVEYLLK